MGLFDMFKGDAGGGNHSFAFVTSLIYMIGADGKIEPEGVGQLLAVLGSEDIAFPDWVQYKNSKKPSRFLKP